MELRGVLHNDKWHLKFRRAGAALSKLREPGESAVLGYSEPQFRRWILVKKLEGALIPRPKSLRFSAPPALIFSLRTVSRKNSLLRESEQILRFVLTPVSSGLSPS